jgi:hypothetical protein
MARCWQPHKTMSEGDPMTMHRALTASGNQIRDGIVDPDAGDRLVRVEMTPNMKALEAADLLADAVFDGVNLRLLTTLAREYREARSAASPRTDAPTEET